MASNLLPFLTKLMSLRDPLAEHHSDSVATLARRLGEQIGLAFDALNNLVFAATIHDIGKIALNEFIISSSRKA